MGHTGEDDESQHPVDSHKVDEGENYHHRADEKVFRSVVSKLADLEKIAGDSGHNATGLVIVVEAEGELLEVVEKVLSHLGLHFYADDVTVILDEEAEVHTGDVEREDDSARDDDGGIHFLGNVFVEHFVGDDGVDHADQRDHKSRQHIEHHHFFMRTVI